MLHVFINYADTSRVKKTVLALACILSFSQVHAIEIDIPFMKESAQRDKQDIDSRILLMKHYAQADDYAQAMRYADEVLAISANNPLALKMKKRIPLLQTLASQSGLKKASLSDSFHALYKQNKFKTFINLYEKLQETGVSTTPRMDLDAAYAYYRLNEAEKSSNLLNKQTYADKKRVAKLKKSVALLRAKKSVSTGKSPHALKDYIYLLNQNNKTKKAISVLRKYVKTHPKDADAKVLLAQNLYWSGNIKSAYHALYTVRNRDNLTQTLYANILYEKGDYLHAVNFLELVSPKAKDKKERYNLLKRLAYAYKHLGEDEKADKLFAKLRILNPQDKELIAYQVSASQNENYLLLQSAVNAHKKGDYLAAITDYERYYEKTQDPKIAKEIAEIYYFNLTDKETLAFPYFKAYLEAFPDDTLLRYHYASLFEKKKRYTQSIPEFQKIMQNPNAKEYDLARYHCANSLMKTFKDSDWLQARKILRTLVQELNERADPKEKDLLKYSSNLLKIAKGPIRKPTRYKDIVLTEGAHKIVDRKSVFPLEDVEFHAKPSKKILFDRNANKRKLWVGVDYVDDKVMRFYNAKVGVQNLLVAKGVHYNITLEKFTFDSIKKHKGTGAFLEAATDTLSVGLGIEKFENFTSVVPKLSWKTSLGNHSLFADFYYRNGAFTNYRGCMVSQELSVYHLGLYDKIVQDDLNFMEWGLDINRYDDKNVNLYGQLTYPLYYTRLWGIEHNVVFNENIEYNSKINVCSRPADFYDAGYLKYQPIYRFAQGEIRGSVGAGYSFKGKEPIYSYGLGIDYTIGNFVTLDFSCESLQSSFTTDTMDFCHLNLVQAW